MIPIIAMKYYLLIPFFYLLIFSPLYPVQGQETAYGEQLGEIDSSPESQNHLPQKSISLEENLHDPLIDPELTETDHFQAKFMNMLFILGLLISFMLLASWMLKRMTKSKVTQMNQASSIKILETRHLTPRSTIYLIEVKGQHLLIGESVAGVSHLATIGFLEEGDDTNYKRPAIPPYFSNPTKLS
ncbi:MULTISPECIES: FliO/MopB family protein [unclassified Candidatus Protochlamydia]|uniref:FliO/MopB family protein n=1 Tax=unclassified Candidatus Protochlamydia TaxID=2644816 RepID=UPI0005A7E272|nr:MULTISPECIES: flagellar biosynthetic protein FliO [unclassified Candidatus Protochlamydia]